MRVLCILGSPVDCLYRQVDLQRSKGGQLRAASGRLLHGFCLPHDRVCHGTGHSDVKRGGLALDPRGNGSLDRNDKKPRIAADFHGCSAGKVSSGDSKSWRRAFQSNAYPLRLSRLARDLRSVASHGSSQSIYRKDASAEENTICPPDRSGNEKERKV